MKSKAIPFAAALFVCASMSLVSTPTRAAKVPNSLVTDERVKQVAFDPKGRRLAAAPVGPRR